jgi:hypothetical protein
MPHITFRPTSRPFHRYTSQEMSDPLPPVLFKALPLIYAQRLIDDGEMMWSTLTWFRNQEDPSRGDVFEATRRNFPPGGQGVTRLKRAGRPEREQLHFNGHGTEWRPVQSHHIFIYSMTLDERMKLHDPAVDAMVEIFDPGVLVERVLLALGRHRSARANTLIHRAVSYYDDVDDLGPIHSLPDRLAASKRSTHAWQREYRFAFGTRADVFDFDHVEGSLLSSDVIPSILVLDPQRHRMRLRVGALSDCCRILGPAAFAD